MSVMINEGVFEEVESLKAILMDDVSIKQLQEGAYIVTVVNPQTGDNVDEQYVCITLEAILESDYPKTKPIIKLSKPRGLDDKKLKLLRTRVDEFIDDYLGTPVVYGVFQVISDMLTNFNLPSGICSICLYEFLLGDMFIRVDCYHYYHSVCLQSLYKHSKAKYDEEFGETPDWKKSLVEPYKPVCAVCRTVITEINLPEDPPTPMGAVLEPPIVISDEVRAMQAKMNELRLYQAAKGGLIDENSDNGPPPLIITDTPSNDAPSTSRAALANDAVAAARNEVAGNNNNNNKKNNQKQSPAKKNANAQNGQNNAAKNGNTAQNAGKNGNTENGGQAPEPAKVPYRGFNRNNRGRGRRGHGGSR